MFLQDQYELLDFGAGRKLERFAGVLVDRPAPATADIPRRASADWSRAELVFCGEGWSGTAPANWRIRYGPLTMGLRPTPTGQLGLFPEQADNWDWIAAQLQDQPAAGRVLNLFAYTGGSTLAAAAAGAEVVHVDAASSVVQWARENAAASQLQDRPVRWITDDACKFAEREVRRGNRYQGVILDPPSYGHGPKGQAWKFERDLHRLLAVCRQLLADGPHFALLTAHTTGWTAKRLRAALLEGFGPLQGASLRQGNLKLLARGGRQLASGCFARWSRC